MQPKRCLAGTGFSVFLRRASGAALVAVAFGAGVQSAQAQDVTVRLHGGIVQPLASTGDYFELGPSIAVDVGLPLTEALDLVLDLDYDWLQTTDLYPTPTTSLWRYRVGVEAGLMGNEGDGGFLLKGLVGAGATTAKSHEFWLASRRPYTFKGETINQTSLTATGGFRVGLETSDGITWWLTSKVNWTPVKDINQDALQELASNQLDPLGSQLSASITLGVTLW